MSIDLRGLPELQRILGEEMVRFVGLQFTGAEDPAIFRLPGRAFNEYLVGLGIPPAPTTHLLSTNREELAAQMLLAISQHRIPSDDTGRAVAQAIKAVYEELGAPKEAPLS